MKTLTILISCVSLAWACPNGSTPWRDGVCTADLKPESAPEVQPSDEKPPRSGMPSWQSPNIKTIEAPPAPDDYGVHEGTTSVQPTGKKP